jgi:YbbR domain-containing protein
MNFLKKNLGLKLMALIISLVVWTYVESQVLIQDHVQVQFTPEFTNLSSDLTATVASRATVQATGPPDIIKDIKTNMAADLSANKLLLFVDLSRAVPGTNTYGATFDRRRLPYEGVTWDSPQVTVNVEEKQSKGPMKIGVDALTLPSGFTLDRASTTGTTITPPKAKVKGRDADIRKVDHLVVQIQMQNYDDPSRVLQNVVVEAKDAAGQDVPHVEVDPATVAVHPVLIHSTGEKSVFVNVPIEGSPAPGYEVTDVKVTPSQVLITGQPDPINFVDILNTDPVRISDLDKSKTQYVKLRQPKQWQVDFKHQPIKVEVNIRKTYNPRTPPAPIVPPDKPATQVIPPSVSAH